MYEKEQIINSLKPLFKEAIKKKLWFYSNYQGFWISPKELKKQNDNGGFIWGPNNWQLRDPKEKTEELLMEIKDAKQELKIWKRKTSCKKIK
jgi:hypothetical protein